MHLRSIGASIIFIFSSFNFNTEKTENALLWEISGKDLKEPSYLFGTIHAICQNDLDLDKNLMEKFAKSKQLVLEIDMDDPSFMMIIQQNTMMKNGEKISNLLSNDQYQKVATFFQDSLNINLAFFDNYKPLLLNSLMLSKILQCFPQAYETTLMNLAKEQSKEVLGVETAKEQMDVFDRIPYEKQAELLYDAVENFEKSRKEFHELLGFYKKQDLDGAYKFIKKSSKEINDFEEILLMERNEKWIPVMEKLASENSTFFAVGAGHLPGKKGLITLLRNAGYHVKAVK